MKLPKFNKQDIKNSKMAKAYFKFVNSNLFVGFIIKTVSAVAIWICALCPVWVYLIIRWLIEPADFWQEFAIFVVCALVIGWLQVALFIGAFVLTLIVLVEDV